MKARPFSALWGCGRARLPKGWLRCVVVFAEVSPARNPLGSPGLCVGHWLAGGLAPWQMVCAGRSGAQQKGIISLSLCTDFHEVPFMEVGWAPAEFPASGGCTSKNHREDVHAFFMASHIWGLFPTSPFALLSDLRRSFFLASIITCLPDPFKNSGFNPSRAVFVSSLAWVTQTRPPGAAAVLPH